jgi:phage-related protein
MAPADRQITGSRDILWLASALDTARTFPLAARRRLGVELVTARRLGMNGTWEPFRGAGPSVFSLRLRGDGRGPTVPFLEYRVVCASPGLDLLACVHAFSRSLTRGQMPISQKHVGFARARLKEITLDREEGRESAACRAELLESSEGVFRALGFPANEAQELERRAALIAEARHVVKRKGDSGLSHFETRALLEGRIDELSAERLSAVLAT